MTDAPLLKVRDISKFYGARTGCRNVSFDLWPGEVLAIVGESGSGKTTLLNCLATRLMASSGTVEYRMRDGQMREQTFTFTVDGEKLTVTISGMPGGDAIEIKDGTAKADDITFNVVRSFQGQEVKIMYKGKAADGEIKFSSWRDGNEGQTREFTAKRVTS